MTEADVERCADALCAYQREVTAVFGRREQREWSRFYLCGQLSKLERKTMEPMVLALLKTDRNAVRGLQQFIVIVYRVSALLGVTSEFKSTLFTADCMRRPMCVACRE